MKKVLLAFFVIATVLMGSAYAITLDVPEVVYDADENAGAVLSARGVTLTFEEGGDKYSENCRQRNLREGTIGHYRQSYLYFFKYFDTKMPIEDIDEQTYKDYVVHLKSTLDNDVSINSYLRDLITTLHFFMNEGWLSHFKMQAIKVDKSYVETYSEPELQALLKKPNVKKCNFTEYQCWVMTNFLFSTGVRQRSLMNIKIKDVDFDNNVVYVNVTKNRKPLIGSRLMTVKGLVINARAGINAYLSGDATSLPELEAERLFYNGEEYASAGEAVADNIMLPKFKIQMKK